MSFLIQKAPKKLYMWRWNRREREGEIARMNVTKDAEKERVKGRDMKELDEANKIQGAKEQ